MVYQIYTEDLPRYRKKVVRALRQNGFENGCKPSGLTVAHLLGHASTQILPTYVKPLDENLES